MENKTLTYNQIVTINKALSGTKMQEDGSTDGLAFSKLPVIKVLIPLNRLADEIKPHLAHYEKAKSEMIKRFREENVEGEDDSQVDFSPLIEELEDLGKQSVDIAYDVIDVEHLESADMQLAQLRAISFMVNGL